LKSRVDKTRQNPTKADSFSFFWDSFRRNEANNQDLFAEKKDQEAKKN